MPLPARYTVTHIDTDAVGIGLSEDQMTEAGAVSGGRVELAYGEKKFEAFVWAAMGCRRPIEYHEVRIGTVTANRLHCNVGDEIEVTAVL